MPRLSYQAKDVIDPLHNSEMKAVFIDESKSKSYVLCSVFVSVDDVPRIRKGLNKLRLKGQSRIHFVSESDQRRRKILSSIRSLPIEVQFFEVKGRPEAESRRWCFGELVRMLPKDEFFEIWIETDTNHLLLDKGALSETLSAENKSSQVIFSHVNSRSQILLWIPDALAWVRTRGGNWHKELKGFSFEVFEPKKS